MVVRFLQAICCGWNTGGAVDYAAKSRRAVFGFFFPKLCIGDLSIRLIASICCGVAVGKAARFSGQKDGMTGTRGQRCYRWDAIRMRLVTIGLMPYFHHQVWTGTLLQSNALFTR